MKSCLYADFGFGARCFQVAAGLGFMRELHLAAITHGEPVRARNSSKTVASICVVVHCFRCAQIMMAVM